MPEAEVAVPARRHAGDVSAVDSPRVRSVEIAGGSAVLASPLRRLGGLLIDLLIKVTLLQILLAFVVGPSDDLTLELIVAAQIWARGYDAIFYAQGWTPGSRLTRTRIVRLVDGRAPGARWGLVRAAGAVVSETTIIGYLWAFRDARRQTWQDKIAGTVVVEAPRSP